MNTEKKQFVRVMGGILSIVIGMTAAAGVLYAVLFSAPLIRTVAFFFITGCVVAVVWGTVDYLKFTLPVGQVSDLLMDLIRSKSAKHIELRNTGGIRELVANLNKCITAVNELGSREHAAAQEIQERTTNLYGESEKLGQIFSEVTTKGVKTTSTADQIIAMLNTASESARGTSGDIAQVESCISIMVGSVNSAGESASKSRENLDMIAAASEEMSVTVQDIAVNADHARESTANAVARATSAQQSVDQLKAAAAEINKIIDVIVEIAEQTKLLALNATIEAARAGEAGKGFSVVAGEVKELARQTNEATADIRKKIAIMHSSIDNTIDEITQIGGVVHSVDELVSSIASAVEQQSFTTRDISKNIVSVVSVVSEINKRTSDVKAEIDKLAGSVGRIGSSMGQTRNDIVNATDGTNDIHNEIMEIMKKTQDIKENIRNINTGFEAMQRIGRDQYASVHLLVRK